MAVPNPISVPYFVYNKGYHWAKVCLKDQNPLEMIKQIEGGASPFDVIPGFTRDILHFNLERFFPYGLFENKSEIHFDGSIFDERATPEQVGRLFVPHYNTLSRGDMASKTSRTYSLADLSSYKEILSAHPDSETFCYVPDGKWQPVDNKKFFVLSKEQLE